MNDSHQSADDEFEEITSEEVDGVVEALELLAEKVESETIRSMLEDVAIEIHNLFYSDDDVSADAA